MVVIDEADLVLPQKRLHNDFTLIIKAIKIYRAAVQRTSVESVHDWYWLVDEMVEEGYCPPYPCTSPIAVPRTESRLRSPRHAVIGTSPLSGLLPTGYIYPKAERSIRLNLEP